MQINLSPTPSSGSPLLVVAKAAGIGLQSGQVVQATVASVEGSRLLLSIQGHTLEAESGLPLQRGQQLQLRAELAGNRLILRLLEPMPEAPLTRLAREALPRQMPLAPLLSNLAGKQPETLPHPLQAAVRQVLDGLPSMKRLTTAEGLQQSIRDSGMFTESRLLRGNDNLSGDLKANLLRLAAALRATLSSLPAPSTAGRGAAGPLAPQVPPQAPPSQTPPSQPNAPGGTDQAKPEARSGAQPRAEPGPRGHQESATQGSTSSPTAPSRSALSELGTQLLRQTEGAVARLQLNQAVALQRQEGEQPTWVLELPVRPGNDEPVMRLTIRDERRRQAAGDEGGWAVNLDFETQEHGPVRAVVSLLKGEVSTSFWAKRDDTAALFREQLEGLKQRLEEAGLSVGRLASYVGQPAAEELDGSLLPALLDVRA